MMEVVRIRKRKLETKNVHYNGNTTSSLKTQNIASALTPPDTELTVPYTEMILAHSTMKSTDTEMTTPSIPSTPVSSNSRTNTSNTSIIAFPP